jgi:glycerophosphoryl diester phosphodiesterase
VLTPSILAHRGLWFGTTRAPNSREALAAAVEAGFGVETDVRDRLGKLVVSHDPATEVAMELDELVAIYRRSSSPLAVNIKADGLSAGLAVTFRGCEFPWFAFDMSVPEMVRFAEDRLPFYTRHSDVEPDPVLYREAAGVWLDAFAGQWFDLGVVRAHLDNGKRVVIVSPELHGRDARRLVDHIAGSDVVDHPALCVCTDRPELWSTQGENA